MTSFHSYKNLYSYLTKNKLEIADYDFFKKHIQSYSYYELINVFQEKTAINDLNLNFSTIVNMYEIQRELKDITFKYILRFESKFEEVLGHALGEKYGADVTKIISENVFVSNDINYKEKEVRFYKNQFYSTKLSPTKFYKKNKECVPPWIFTRNLTISPLVTFYRLTSVKEKVAAIMLYDIEDDYIINEKILNYFNWALEIIVTYRNIIAHGTNLILNTSINNYNISDNIFNLFFGENFLANEVFKNNRNTSSFITFVAALGMVLPIEQRIQMTSELQSFIDIKIETHYEDLHLYFQLLNCPINLKNELSKISNFITIKPL